MPALLGGHVEALFSAYPSLSGAAGTNKITLIATNGAERSPLAPNVPAIAEIVPGFDFATIVGIYARTGVPSAIVQKIAAEANDIVKEPEVIKQLAAVGIEAKGGGPAEFDRALKGETNAPARLSNRWHQGRVSTRTVHAKPSTMCAVALTTALLVAIIARVMDLGSIRPQGQWSRPFEGSEQLDQARRGRSRPNIRRSGTGSKPTWRQAARATGRRPSASTRACRR